MLRAIAIYDYKEGDLSKSFTPVKTETKSRADNDSLENLEKKTLPSFAADLVASRIFHARVDGEHHYVKKQSEDKSTVFAIVSQKPLEPSEVNYLFININHVNVRSAVVKTRLKDIITNPLGYTGRDIQISKVQTSVTELKCTMFQVIDQAIDRGEKLEVLGTKAIQLEEDAKRFHKEAAKLNSCCKSW